MEKRVLILIGSAIYNKGSEALLTGLVKICRNAGVSYIAASSADLKRHGKLDVPLIDDSIPRYGDFYHKTFVVNAFKILLGLVGCTDFVTKIKCCQFVKKAKRFDLIIVVGADNFDRLINKKRELHSLAEMLKNKSNKKILLYDCSIEAKNIDEHLIAAFKTYDAITARDWMSFHNISKFVGNDMLHYFPDPAFVIGAEFVDTGLGRLQNKMVGINVSNLVAGKEKGDTYSAIFNSYCNLIECIIEKYGMEVLLIPHVMNGADLSILGKLYNKYKSSNYVHLIENENLNARQLKYIISQCELFVGARTHATIAAYSSCVPTLVLGYSIKSIGIARDLFGSEKNYVIPVSELTSNAVLVDGFNWLYENKEEIRNHLKKVMPKYIENVWKTKELIEALLENSDEYFAIPQSEKF